MNRFALAAGIAVLALLGLPWIFGAMAQQRLSSDVERLNTEGEIAAEVLDYARGWRTSTAVIELRLPEGALAQVQVPANVPVDFGTLRAVLSEPVRLVVEMRHGPLLGTEGAPLGLVASTIHLDPATPGYAALLGELGIPYVFEIRTVTGFGGQADFVAEMPAFTVAREDLDAAFSGLAATGNYDIAARRFQAQGEAATLSVEAPGATLALEGLRFASDSTHYNDLLRLGTAEASVARLALTGAAPVEEFTLDDFSVRFDIGLEEGGERAALTTAYRFGAFSDGADIDVTDLEIAGAARGIDLDALTDYYLASQATALQADSVAPLSLDAEDALYGLLEAAPTLELAPVRLNWNGEPFAATLRLTTDAANLPPRGSFSMLTLVLGGVVTVDATLELSEPLAHMLATRGMAFQVRRAATQEGTILSEEDVQTLAESQAAIALAGLVAQGLLLSSDEGYLTAARFSQGELTVNGKPVPLFGPR